LFRLRCAIPKGEFGQEVGEKRHQALIVPMCPRCSPTKLLIPCFTQIALGKISVEGLSASAIGCAFSRAKRRGPRPGEKSKSWSTLAALADNGKKSRTQQNSQSQGQNLNNFPTEWIPSTQESVNSAWTPVGTFITTTNGHDNNDHPQHSHNSTFPFTSTASIKNEAQLRIQQQLDYLQQQNYQIEQRRQTLPDAPIMSLYPPPQQLLLHAQLQPDATTQQDAFSPIPLRRAMSADPAVDLDSIGTVDLAFAFRPSMKPTSLPQSALEHLPLLDGTNSVGIRLHAYYTLSINELFRLPATPTNEEYCLDTDQQTVHGLELTLLTATRFAEIAFGAMVRNESGLALDLCHAAVQCLTETADARFDARLTLHVAKAYFLVGVFQVYRGDMSRYAKYVRLCQACLTKLNVSVNAVVYAAVLRN
jgi:hypothetical protein